VLLVSGLTGAAAAQSWTFSTTLALVCAFCGFQAEHPIVLQLKQRRSFKPRFLVWGGLYSAVTLAIAFWLYLSSPVLLWLYLGAIAALVVDTISVLQREQKSIFNEIITFAAVCLSCSLSLRGYHWHNFNRCNGTVGTEYALLFQHHFYG
jgi:hypothetical protein